MVDGVMYLTAANECHALDAGTGRRLWVYQRPRSKGLAGDAASGINRGVAVGGDRVFMVTDNAHLIALDRRTGALLWETEMADSRLNYGATLAPLAVAVARPGCTPTIESVRAHLAPHVAKWWLPDAVVLVDSLPKTGTGKYQKHQVRAMFKDAFSPASTA